MEEDNQHLLQRKRRPNKKTEVATGEPTEEATETDEEPEKSSLDVSEFAEITSTEVVQRDPSPYLNSEVVNHTPNQLETTLQYEIIFSNLDDFVGTAEKPITFSDTVGLTSLDDGVLREDLSEEQIDALINGEFEEAEIKIIKIHNKNKCAPNVDWSRNVEGLEDSSDKIIFTNELVNENEADVTYDFDLRLVALGFSGIINKSGKIESGSSGEIVIEVKEGTKLEDGSTINSDNLVAIKNLLNDHKESNLNLYYHNGFGVDCA